MGKIYGKKNTDLIGVISIASLASYGTGFLAIMLAHRAELIYVGRSGTQLVYTHPVTQLVYSVHSLSWSTFTHSPSWRTMYTRPARDFSSVSSSSRFLNGLGLGLVIATVSVYIVEIATTDMRVRKVDFSQTEVLIDQAAA